MRKMNQWLLSESELSDEIRQFIDNYFVQGEIFNTPHGSGYWLTNVKSFKGLPRLCFEYDESEYDPNNTKQHAAAIEAWQKNQPLPEHYFIINKDVCIQVFNNILLKYGHDIINQIDLPTVDEALQFTILGEIKYG